LVQLAFCLVIEISWFRSGDGSTPPAPSGAGEQSNYFWRLSIVLEFLARVGAVWWEQARSTTSAEISSLTMRDKQRDRNSANLEGPDPDFSEADRPILLQN